MIHSIKLNLQNKTGGHLSKIMSQMNKIDVLHRVRLCIGI